MAVKPALRASLFPQPTEWKMNLIGWQPVADDVYLMVMYSNGFVSDWVRTASAWRNFTGGRDWWQRPDDDRLFIMMYAEVGY